MQMKHQEINIWIELLFFFKPFLEKKMLPVLINSMETQAK